MEIARMNYYFTGILNSINNIYWLYLVEPAHSRNEYLNDGMVLRCGEVDLSVEQIEITDYDNYSDSWNDTRKSQDFRLTFRKYLGTDCKTSKENVHN
jgi:hypothetical protein